MRNITSKKLSKIWDSIPKTFRVAIWVGISSALTGVAAYLLEVPELAAWSPVLNIILVALKEGKDRMAKK